MCLNLWNGTQVQLDRLDGLVLKVKTDHRSKFSNLSNWKEEA